MGCKGKISLVFIGLVVFSFSSFGQVVEMAVLGVGNITAKSVGETISGPGSGTRQVQSSRDAVGASIEYSQWWGNNAASLDYTLSPTDSKLVTRDATFQWAITRHEFDLSWTHRFRGARIAPFTQTGFAAIVLNGGAASRLDSQFAPTVGFGADLRVSTHLAFRYVLKADLLRASNFSDPTYRGGRTFILEPKFGLVWSSASRRTGQM